MKNTPKNPNDLRKVLASQLERIRKVAGSGYAFNCTDSAVMLLRAKDSQERQHSTEEVVAGFVTYHLVNLVAADKNRQNATVEISGVNGKLIFTRWIGSGPGECVESVTVLKAAAAAVMPPNAR